MLRGRTGFFIDENGVRKRHQPRAEIDKPVGEHAAPENSRGLTGEKLSTVLVWKKEGRMTTCWIVAGVLGGITLLFNLIEIHYFVRIFFTAFIARFCKKRVHILDETSVYSICTTTDVDTLLYHMNNARYFRELDFARADFYQRTNLYNEICTQGSGVVQGAATIRYRRFLKPFTIFKITSKIIYWDEKSIFMEHRFITPSDGFVRAIAICRQRVLDCNAEAVIGALMDRGVKQTGNVEAGVTQPSHVRPQIPPEVARWLESNEISSAALRPSANGPSAC